MFKRLFIFLLLLLVQAPLNELLAQKKVDQVIPDAEKKRVLRAKKLFNQFKIYEGERILKDLVREHPNDFYYHEALVQLQRQVLRQLRPAQAEYESYQQQTMKDSAADEDSNPDLFQHITKADNTPLAKPDSTEQEWNGLDPGPRKVDKVKSKVVDEAEGSESELKDATVTIDSSLLREDFTIALDENGEPIKKAPKKKNKTFERQLKAISELAQIPYESYKNDLIQNCRLATLQVAFSDSASYYLREFLVDTLDPDVQASDEAREAFERGLEALGENDLADAKKQLEHALKLYPEYYNAHLLLGDVWLRIGKDSAVIKEYNKARILQPELSEPLERLSLFYYERGKFEEAASYCIDAIIHYPQQHYFQLLKRIVNKSGKDFNTQWLLRDVYPLSTSKNYFEITAKEKTPWWQYQAAEGDVHSYFDTLGMVRPNDKTNERYLELYAWKRMLDDTKRDLFPFAKAMNKIGLLECYVLVSCFHHDLYGQFADYAKRHPDKIRDYFYILINWEDKKFDKLRKEFYPKEEPKKGDVKMQDEKNNTQEKTDKK